MIPFILLGRDHGPSSSSTDFPRASYIFLVMAVAVFGVAVYIAAQYWVGPTWDVFTDVGNIFYHDPVCFLFSGMFLCIAGMAAMYFLMWHGPFTKPSTSKPDGG